MPFFPSVEEIGRNESLAPDAIRLSFGVLSISQPERWGHLREFPRFAGFFGFILEIGEGGVAMSLRDVGPFI